MRSKRRSYLWPLLLCLLVLYSLSTVFDKSGRKTSTGETVFLIAVLALVSWKVRQWICEGDSKTPPIEAPRSSVEAKPVKRSYVLKAGPAIELFDMPEATSRLFTYQDEKKAAKARQRLWMQYEDRQGHVTERTVEIYQPEDDEVIFTWCCMARAPRTFARRSIQRWRLLPDTFIFDPIVNQYWEEEGTRDMSEQLPWLRWLSDQPSHISKRYMK